jgi:hypothetical protein
MQYPLDVWIHTMTHCDFATLCLLERTSPGTFGRWASRELWGREVWNGVTLCEALREDFPAVIRHIAPGIRTEQSLIRLVNMLIKLGAWRNLTVLFKIAHMTSPVIQAASHKLAKRGRYGLVVVLGLRYPGSCLLADTIYVLSRGGTQNLSQVDSSWEFTNLLRREYAERYICRGVTWDLVGLLPKAWVERFVMEFASFIQRAGVRRRSGRAKAMSSECHAVVMSIAVADEIQETFPKLLIYKRYRDPININ